MLLMCYSPLLMCSHDAEWDAVSCTIPHCATAHGRQLGPHSSSERLPNLSRVPCALPERRPAGSLSCGPAAGARYKMSVFCLKRRAKSSNHCVFDRSQVPWYLAFGRGTCDEYSNMSTSLLPVRANFRRAELTISTIPGMQRNVESSISPTFLTRTHSRRWAHPRRTCQPWARLSAQKATRARLVCPFEPETRDTLPFVPFCAARK